MEKINGIPLSTLHINDALGENELRLVLESIDRIHSSIIENKEITIYENYAVKIQIRYDSHDYSSYPKHEEIYEHLIAALEWYEVYDMGESVVIHGDPVFSNIIMTDQKTLKFIDMRGKLGDNLSLFGDRFYDYAKIYQSLIGYDFIQQDIPPKETLLRPMFENYVIHRFGKERMLWVAIITLSLIFSLIPLHTDKDKCAKYYELALLLNSKIRWENADFFDHSISRKIDIRKNVSMYDRK